MDSIEDFQTSYVDGRVEANITKSIDLSFPFEDLNKKPVYLFFGKGKSIDQTHFILVLKWLLLMAQMRMKLESLKFDNMTYVVQR